MRLRQEEELETLKANFENSKSFKKLQIQPNSEKEQILSRNISENLFTRLDNMKVGLIKIGKLKIINFKNLKNREKAIRSGENMKS